MVTVEFDVGISEGNEVEISMEDEVEVEVEVVVVWDKEVVVRSTGVGRIGGLIVGASTR